MSESVRIYKKILSGKQDKFPEKFWQHDSQEKAKEITKYLFEHILQWDEKEIKEKCSVKVFKEYKLSYMIKSLFQGNFYMAVMNAYENINYWDFKKLPNNFWKDKNNIEKALDYILKETKKESISDIYIEDFIEFNLKGLLLYLKRNDLISEYGIKLKHKKEKEIKIGYNENPLRATINIPTDWLSDLGINKSDIKAIIKMEDQEIIVKKIK